MIDQSIASRIANLEALADVLEANPEPSCPYTAASLRDRAAHLRTLCQECGEKPGGPFCKCGGSDA